MSIVNAIVKIAARPLPKAVSPRANATADYIVAGSFFVMAAVFWKRNKRASIGSLVCGGALLGGALLTDYPGGVRRAIGYPLHVSMDQGLAALAESMPGFMRFEDAAERHFFTIQSAAMMAIASLSDTQAAPRGWLSAA
jgi:hypothetical protein